MNHTSYSTARYVCFNVRVYQPIRKSTENDFSLNYAISFHFDASIVGCRLTQSHSKWILFPFPFPFSNVAITMIAIVFVLEFFFLRAHYVFVCVCVCRFPSFPSVFNIHSKLMAFLCSTSLITFCSLFASNGTKNFPKLWINLEKREAKNDGNNHNCGHQ